MKALLMTPPSGARMLRSCDRLGGRSPEIVGLYPRSLLRGQRIRGRRAPPLAHTPWGRLQRAQALRAGMPLSGRSWQLKQSSLFPRASPSMGRPTHSHCRLTSLLSAAGTLPLSLFRRSCLQGGGHRARPPPRGGLHFMRLQCPSSTRVVMHRPCGLRLS